MSPKARREYIADMRGRYAAASSSARSALLDEVVAVTGYHRKYAIAVLGTEPRPPAKRHRRRIYGPAVAAALAAIWAAAGYPWSARLKAMLPLWLPWLERRVALDALTRRHLECVSTRSIDRLLAPRRALVQRRRNSLTRSGLWVMHQIPIRSERWDVAQAGWLEIDLVSHCGDNAAGEFVYSLNATDIATGWTETRAILGKGQRAVVAALQDIRQSLPFALLGIDSDSGGEFINAHMLGWCRSHKVEFTRSRPYRKNDNAHIEQKNWTHVRKLFGWLRFDSTAACEAMNALYKNEVGIWMNYFQPSVKLVRKERRGSRVRKYYDAPQTPYERLIHRQPMELQWPTVDPFELADRITDAIAQLSAAANRKPAPRLSRYGPNPTVAPKCTEFDIYLGNKLRGATVRR